MYRQMLVVAWAMALAVGCQQMKGKSATTQPMAKASIECTQTAQAECKETACTKTDAPAPAVATSNLAGTWSLAIPREEAQKATITVIDDTHVKIDAGATLSGTYAVQGEYLLIITHDENIRPLAWKINTADSLRVVRSPETGEDYMGVTMVRAADDATVSTESGSQPDLDGTGQ